MTLVFVATTPTNGRELFHTPFVNPSLNVLDLRRGSVSSNPSELTPYGSQVAFASENSQGDALLHIFDPTSTGRTTISIEVAGALPLVFAGDPSIIDIGDLLDVVDVVVLTGARANVHPRHFNTEPHPAHEPYDEARDGLDVVPGEGVGQVGFAGGGDFFEGLEVDVWHDALALGGEAVG